MPIGVVFIFLIAAYGSAILAGIWFIAPIEVRTSWQKRAQGAVSRCTRQAYAWFSRSVQSGRSPMVRLSVILTETLARNKSRVMIAVLLLCIPVLLIVLFRPGSTLGGYDELPRQSDPVVIALLQGEQLVPPPPLPPEVFVTREVEAIRPALSDASREWMLLDADFRQRLLTVFVLMEQKGYRMALLEGYRSPERQNYLASLGSQVTNAGAFQSYHQFGLAGDCAFYRNGKLVISEKDSWAMEGYRLYGELAEAAGLTWGGRWKMMDFGHVELRKAGKTHL